ncbi:MAG: sodium:solute symporter family protein [Micrococcaceae bacterium]|nr:sodium:solute symporter family protein [Micrococcaceae bacterium]
MDVFTLSVIGSFLLITIVGIVMSRKVKDKTDYFLAGKDVGVLLIVGTLIASYLSTVALMGEAGTSFDGFPWAIFLLTALAAVGYFLGVLFFGRYLRESKALTIPEFFGDRFDSKRLRGLAGLMVLVGIGLYLVAVTRGISLVLETVTGIGGFWAILITWAAFSLFTILSGSKGVIVTDLIMFFVFMIGGSIGFISIFNASGGIKEVFASLANNEASREGLMWHGAVSSEGAAWSSPLEVLIYILTFGIVWMFVVAVSPWQSSRYMMARSNHVAIRSAIVAVVLIPVFYIFMVFAAYAVNLTNPDIAPSENVFIWAAYNIMPTIIGVVMVSGIMAAGLSSASTFLSLVGFSAVNDVAPMFRRRSAPKSAAEQGVGGSRIAMLLVGAVALIVTAVATPGVFEIGYMAASFFAAAWGFVAIVTTQSKRVTERGAFYGMLAGGATVLVFESLVTFGGLELPMILNPALLGLVASLIALIIGTMTTTPSEKSLVYISDLKARVETPSTPAELKVTNRYIYAAIAIIVVVFVGLLVFYVPAMLQTA